MPVLKILWLFLISLHYARTVTSGKHEEDYYYSYEDETSKNSDHITDSYTDRVELLSSTESFTNLQNESEKKINNDEVSNKTGEMTPPPLLPEIGAFTSEKSITQSIMSEGTITTIPTDAIESRTEEFFQQPSAFINTTQMVIGDENIASKVTKQNGFVDYEVTTEWDKAYESVEDIFQDIDFNYTVKNKENDKVKLPINSVNDVETDAVKIEENKEKTHKRNEDNTWSGLIQNSSNVTYNNSKIVRPLFDRNSKQLVINNVTQNIPEDYINEEETTTSSDISLTEQQPDNFDEDNKNLTEKINSNLEDKNPVVEEITDKVIVKSESASTDDIEKEYEEFSTTKSVSANSYTTSSINFEPRTERILENSTSVSLFNGEDNSTDPYADIKSVFYPVFESTVYDDKISELDYAKTVTTTSAEEIRNTEKESGISFDYDYMNEYLANDDELTSTVAPLIKNTSDASNTVSNIFVTEKTIVSTTQYEEENVDFSDVKETTSSQIDLTTIANLDTTTIKNTNETDVGTSSFFDDDLSEEDWFEPNLKTVEQDEGDSVEKIFEVATDVAAKPYVMNINVSNTTSHILNNSKIKSNDSRKFYGIAEDSKGNQLLVNLTAIIDVNGITEYVPNNASLKAIFDSSGNISANITWNKEHKNNSISFCIINQKNLSFINEVQFFLQKGHQIISTEKKKIMLPLVKNNSKVTDAINFKNEIRLHFIDYNIVLRKLKNKCKTNKKNIELAGSYVREITSGCIGLAGIAIVIIYFVIKRIKSQRNNFKPTLA